MKRTALLAVSHLLAIGLGFVVGVYTLPILTAPDAPTASQVDSAAGEVRFVGRFTSDLEGSDLLHWGEGEGDRERHRRHLEGGHLARARLQALPDAGARSETERHRS